MNSAFIGTLLLSIIGISFGAYIPPPDYCDRNLCKGLFPPTAHIACNNTGIFGPECSKDAKLIEITTELKDFIIDQTNIMRSQIASGNIEGYDTAQKMPIVQWDTELAKLAQMNVKQCTMDHDCHNTEKYKYSGQNIASLLSSKPIKNLNTAFLDSLKLWFDEYVEADQSITDSFKATPNGSKTQWGHFTVMVNQKVTRMGCAASTFSTIKHKKKHYKLIFTCNFSYTNILDEPVYETGDSCSQCTTGCSDRYEGLCNINEEIIAIPDLLL